MRFAVVGSRGLLGTQLMASIPDAGHVAEGFDRNGLNLEIAKDADLTRVLEGFDVVINAAAYTAVDQAESNGDLAFLVNGHAAGYLAKASASVGARFIQVSTDYVFSGEEERPYSILDSPNPKTVYGKSKSLGEELAASFASDLIIIRTAWLYGQFGNCFPKKIARLLGKGDALNVVSDQIGQPTWTRDVADQIISYSKLSQPPKIVHSVSSGNTSWAEFATSISESFSPMAKFQIRHISSEFYDSPAKRPPSSVLDNTEGSLEHIGHWRERWALAAPEVLREFLH